MFFKVTDENGIITMIGEQSICPSYAVEISETEYNELQAEILARGKRIAGYVEKIKSGEMTLEDIENEEEREEVAEILSIEVNDYGIPMEVYNQIIDDYTMELLEGGVIE